MTLTNEETIKGNRVIADGLKESRIWETLKGKTRLYYNPVHDTVNCEDHELEYHSSWEWLMPAIELIREELNLNTIWETLHHIADSRKRGQKETITDVWKAVVIYFESKK